MFLDDAILNTGHSCMKIAPRNSRELYTIIGTSGFNSIKGDTQVTSDGGIVMCHDNGFTFNAEGRITNFDKNNFVDFNDLTFAQCKGLEYEAFGDEYGYHARVATFEDFVQICKATGCICYATLRGRRIDELVPEVLRIIRKYHMEQRTLINSFTYETLALVRSYSSVFPLSNVQPNLTVLEETPVRNMAELGNAGITMFSSKGHTMCYEYVDASRPLLDTARSLGLFTHMAIVHTREDYEKTLNDGFTGFHIGSVFPPFVRSDKDPSRQG